MNLVPIGQAPGLIRRLAACLYDCLVLIALLMVAGAAWVGLSRTAVPPGDWLFRAYLLAVAALFFAGFWRRGETLGMRAWKLRIVAADGRPPGWGRGLLRFAMALLSWAVFGLGFWWVLVDLERLAWHDRLSGTRLVLRNPEASAHARHAE
ncbi:MAG TPA: RDD family protein [Gammaproteobacteria bacterium]|nr:RDD family protein [Gammaproteobacteria bacterium]